MKSYTTLQNLFNTLSLNTNSNNTTLAGILINDNHRYLIQKYFDNEAQTTITTIGPQTLTLTTSTLASGSTSATLTATWTYPSCKQLLVFSDGEQRNVSFFQNSTSITWISATTAAQTSASISCVGVQSYPLGANVSKIKNDTITIGQLVYTPAPVQSIGEWTQLNALPYTSNIPCYFFVYNNQLNFWPIPSSTGNIITIYCQINVPDMTYADYTTGTISSATVGSNQIVGTATNWATPYPTGVDLTPSNLFISITPPGDDGLYYQVQSFIDNTHINLLKPIVYAPNTSGANYTIGQYPLLQGDFHDIIVYWALEVYFNSIVKDTEKYQMFQGIRKEKEDMFMRAYLSTKQVNVDLSVSPQQRNPNLFTFASS
jgi:hypothetical protein